MSTVIVDAYDSFVHIIYQYFLELDANPVVVRSDELTPTELALRRPDAVVLGPGPGHPVDCGHVEIVHELAGDVPLLGVCLGHQAIGVAFGARVAAASHLVHGKTSLIRHDGDGVFAAHRGPFNATRYHSLVVEEATIGHDLEVTARTADDGYIMGLRHRTKPIESVQFHPESICTEDGLNVFRSFHDAYVAPARSIG